MSSETLEVLFVFLGEGGGLSDFSLRTTSGGCRSCHRRHHSPSCVPALLELVQTVPILVKADNFGLVSGFRAVDVIKTVRVEHLEQILREMLPTCFREHGRAGCLHRIRVGEVWQEMLVDFLVFFLFKHRSSNERAAQHPGDCGFQPKRLVEL